MPMEARPPPYPPDGADLQHVTHDTPMEAKAMTLDNAMHEAANEEKTMMAENAPAAPAVEMVAKVNLKAAAMNYNFMTNDDTANNKIMSNVSTNVSYASTNVLPIFDRTVVKANRNDLVIIIEDIKAMWLGAIIMLYVGLLKT